MDPNDNWQTLHFSDGEIRFVAKGDMATIWERDTSTGAIEFIAATEASFNVAVTGAATIASTGGNVQLSTSGTNSIAKLLSSGSNGSIQITSTKGTIITADGGIIDMTAASGGVVISPANLKLFQVTTSNGHIQLNATGGLSSIIGTAPGNISWTSTAQQTLTSTAGPMVIGAGTNVQISATNNITLATGGAGQVKIQTESVNPSVGAVDGNYLSRVAGVWRGVTPGFLSSTLTNAHIFVGSVGNVATDVAVTGDVTITAAGVTAIGALKVTNAQIANTTIDLTTKVTGLLPVANGGTGVGSLTDHGVLVGSGTAAVDALAVGTNGQLLIGQTTADPAFTTVTGDITITAGGVTTIKTDVALAGNPTTTTQTQGNNSTRIATTAYVDVAETTWSTYTPAVTQSAVPTQSVGEARYYQRGKHVSGYATVNIGSGTTGTAGVAVAYDLPFAPLSTGAIIGTMFIYDSSANLIYLGALTPLTGVAVTAYADQTAVTARLGSAHFTAALANGDVVQIQFDYEKA